MADLSIEEKEDVVIISITDEITMTTVNDIELACKKYVNSKLTVLALDLNNVQFIDSFGISRIIKLSKSFIGTGTEFILINMNDNIHQIFKIATFDRLFTILTKSEFMEKYLQ